jgi:hypothetical protein
MVAAHHGLALFAREIGEFAGRAERRQAMHAGLDQVGRKPPEQVGEDRPFRVDRRDQIGKDAVKVGHALR